MDILKVLSRGTKKSSKQLFDPTQLHKPLNPQLFNDPTRGQKRKRNEEQPRLNQEDDDDLDIDFFAPRDAKKPSAQPITHEPPEEKKRQSPLLDEEQVRQVLRSHRLKVTLLSSHDSKAARVKKAKKDTSKSKAKDTKKQLFPQPLISFSELRATYNVSPRLESNLAAQGFRIPTEIQLGSLPVLLHPDRAVSATAAEEMNFKTSEGIDFLGVAPTGSGKTLSFLIPTINNIMRWRSEDEKREKHVLEAIVVAPTKELCHQIVNEGRKLSQGTGVRIVEMRKNISLPTENLVDGGSNSDEKPSSDSEANSSDGDESSESGTKGRTTTKSNILVTTPLVLQNFLKSRTLPTVKSLILDEVDVLLDDAFRSQTVGIWSACTNPDLRLTCWSATMGSHIEAFILEQLKSRAPPKSSVPLIRLVVGLKDTAVPLVKHKLVFTATEQGKLFALRQLLHPKSSSNSLPFMRLPILIFTQTIERATALHTELKFDFPIEAGGSSRIAVLHSALPDAARSKVMARFRAGEIFVLITTDLLMRGIDLVGVNGVVNYDLPATAAAYVHRVGRTGRAGHDGGVAITLYTTEDVAHLKTIANVISLSEKQAGKQEGEGMPKWLIDSLPEVNKEEKRKLRERGVESRRGNKTKITSQSAWERRKENNRRGAIAGSKRRKDRDARDDTHEGGGESEWGGIED